MLGIHVEHFDSNLVLEDTRDHTEDSLNNLWTVGDGVTLTVEDMTVHSSGLSRSHFVVRGGEGSVLNAGTISGWGKTIDIAGFDLVNIENFVGSSNINAEVSISAKKIIHTLSEINTGNAMIDTVQGYAFIGTEEHIIHADEYILERNVSSGDYAGVSFPQAAFYFLNVAQSLPNEPGYHNGSLEMHARSIRLNNYAEDEAAIAVVGKGGAAFYADDISVKGFSGILSADGRGSGNGNIEFHSNTFRMENDEGFSTTVGKYATYGDILIEAKERGDLIGLSEVYGNTDVTLTGGHWNIDVKPRNFDDLITVFTIYGDFKVDSDTVFFGTTEDLSSVGGIGFKDGRLFTLTSGGDVRFGDFEHPISGIIDSNFVAQVGNFEIFGSNLQVTGEVVLSKFWETEPSGEILLQNGSVFTGSVRGYDVFDLEYEVWDPDMDYTPYLMQAKLTVGLDSSTWNVTRDSWNACVAMNDGHLNLAYRPDGVTDTYRTLKTGLLAGYDARKDELLREGGGTLYFNVDLAREAEGALDRIEADNVYGTFVGSVNFDNPQDIDGKLMTESSLIHQGGGSMTVNNPGGKYLAGDGMLSRWTWKFLPESMRDTIDTTNPDALWALGNTSNDEAGDWVLVRVPSKPWTPIDPPKEPDLPWTDLEPSKPTIPWTPIEPSTPVEPSEPEEPEEPDTSVPWTPIGPSTPVTPPEQIDPPSEVEDSFKMGSTIMQAISWWSEKNDLRRRLGEVRYGTQAGAWVKAFHRKDSAGRSTGSSFTQRATGVHVGYDTLVGETGDSRWLVGATFRYANSDQDGDGGLGDASGRMDEYSLKGYFVWMNDAGWYADSLVQAGWYEHEMEGVPNSGRGRFKADYNVWGMGTSLEVGRKIEFGTNHTGKLGWMNGMFVEPQVELSFFRTAGTDYTLSTGMHVDQDKADFLTGRAGLVIGKKFDYSSDPSDRRYVQVALSGGFTREFLGENTMFYRGTDGEVLHQNEKLDELRHYYGMVWDWQFRQDMRFYGEVEREVGDYYRKDYSVTFGLKYSFN